MRPKPILEGATAARFGAFGAPPTQKASNYEKKVLAVDEYNRALTNFTERYGRPEVWLRDVGIAGFKKMKVDGWMPN